MNNFQFFFNYPTLLSSTFFLAHDLTLLRIYSMILIFSEKIFKYILEYDVLYKYFNYI